MSIDFQAPFFFGAGIALILKSNRDSFSAPVPSGKAAYALQKNSKVS